MIEMKQTTEPVILFLSPILFQFSGKLGLFLKKTTTTIGVLHPLITTSSGNSLLHNHLLPGVFKETPLLSGCAAGLGIFFSTAELVGNHPFGLAKKKPFNKMPWRIFGGADQHHFFFWAAQHIPGWILYFSLYLIFFWGVSKVENFQASALHTTNKKHIALFFFLLGEISDPLKYNMVVSKNSDTPKSSILIGFSIIFTIHFGGFPPIFGSTPICL